MNYITVEQKQALWLEENGIKPELWSALQSSVFPGAKPASIKLAIDYCAARKLERCYGSRILHCDSLPTP